MPNHDFFGPHPPKAKSKEQAFFQEYMPLLLDLRKKEMNGTLDRYGKEQKDEILASMYLKVRNYGYERMQEMVTQKSKVTKQQREDMISQLKVAFFEHVYDYDPYRATPTTYFKPYFTEAIRIVLQKEYIHQSPHYCTNMMRVRREIATCESQGIEYTDDMISNKTGLSTKVVKDTIKRLSQKEVELPEDAHIQSSSRGPEELILERDNREKYPMIIKNALSEESAKIFLMRMNFDGEREMPYESIAKSTGMDNRTIRRIMTKACLTLKDDKSLIRQIGYVPKEKKKIILPSVCADDTADIAKNQLKKGLSRSRKNETKENPQDQNK